MTDSQEIEQVAKILYEVFDDLPENFYKQFGFRLPIKFPCEVSYGNTLGEIIKINREDL